MRRAHRISSVLFVLAIPVLLITGGVTYAFNEPRLYEYGFDKYDISQVTGIDEEGLRSVARQIRGYFNSTDEPLQVRAEVFGEERELFTPREATHMRDVKRLLWGVYSLGAASATYVALFMALGFWLYRRGFSHLLARLSLWGSGLTVALVVVVALGSLVGFDSLFLWFHQLSFSNDFWQLDPNRHFLVMMFPQDFWFDATLFVGMLTLGAAAILGGISGGWMWWSRRSARRPAPLVAGPRHAAEP